MICVTLPVGTLASDDWSSSIFGQLRRLLSSTLSADEFTLTEEDMSYFPVQNAGFVLLNDEYSTVPTLKEFLYHGWNIKEKASTGAQELEDGSFGYYVRSYNLKKGSSKIEVGICRSDALAGIKAKDCRISFMEISLVTLTGNESNISSFMLSGTDLLDINFEKLDQKLGEHVSWNETAHHIENEGAFDWESSDTYIYNIYDTALQNTGVYSIEYDVITKDNSCNTIRIYFNAFVEQ